MAYEGLVDKLMNKTPSDSQKKDLEATYSKLYPYMVKDFVHIQDMLNTIESLKSQISEIKSRLFLDGEGGQHGESEVRIPLDQEEALNLIVYEGQIRPNGAMAREDRRVGGDDSSEMEEFQELLDPENPTAE